MNKLKLYIDTSVIGGCFDQEFSEWSNKLFEFLKTGKLLTVISEVVLEELSDSPENVKFKLDEIPIEYKELLRKTDECELLASKYIESKIISEKYYEDAVHIALATINKVDVLVSWNFKHIVNYNRIVKYNSINLMNNYKPIEIRTPKEVIPYE